MGSDESRLDRAPAEQPTERATVGPTSRWGKPVTIAGAVLVVLALLWAIFASGWFL